MHTMKMHTLAPCSVYQSVRLFGESGVDFLKTTCSGGRLASCLAMAHGHGPWPWSLSSHVTIKQRSSKLTWRSYLRCSARTPLSSRTIKWDLRERENTQSGSAARRCGEARAPVQWRSEPRRAFAAGITPTARGQAAARPCARASGYLTSLQTRLREWLRCLSRAVTRSLNASSSWSVTTTCGMPALLGVMPSSLRARTVRGGERVGGERVGGEGSQPWPAAVQGAEARARAEARG